MRVKIKHKKGVAVAAAIILLIVAVSVGYQVVQSGETDDTLAENQRFAYAYVTAISGNELSYMEVEESVAKSALESSSDAEKKTDSAEEASGKEESGQTKNNSGGQEPPSGDMSGGEAPDGDRSDTDMSGGEASVAGTSSETWENTEAVAIGNEGSTEDGGSTADSSGGKSGKLGKMDGGTQVTSLIPVGVTVHTASEAKTSFSRLASGDLLKLLLETDADGNEVIVEIWMLQ